MFGLLHWKPVLIVYPGVKGGELLVTVLQGPKKIKLTQLSLRIYPNPLID